MASLSSSVPLAAAAADKDKDMDMDMDMIMVEAREVNNNKDNNTNNNTSLDVTDVNDLKGNINPSSLKPEWHVIPGFDQHAASNLSLPQRLRYLFDFQATKKGNGYFLSRLTSNLRECRTVHANISQRAQTSEDQRRFMLSLPRTPDDLGRINNDTDMQRGIRKVEGELRGHLFWMGVLEVECELCQVGIQRVNVAGRAGELLRRRWDGRLNDNDDDHDTYGLESREELERLFLEWQLLRDRVVEAVAMLVDWTGGRGEWWGRHRNEVWDVWP